MKKFLSDTVFITVGGFLSKAKGIVFIPIMTMSLGLEGYGAFVQIIINAKLFTQIFSMELGMGFQRFISTAGSDQKEILSKHFFSAMSLSLALGLMGFILMFFASPFLAEYLLEGKYVDSLQLSSFLLLTNPLFNNTGKFLLARSKFKAFSIFNLLYDLLPYIGFVISGVIYKTVYAGYLTYVIIDAAVYVALLVYIVKDLKFVLPSRLFIKRYFHYTYPLSLSAVEGGLLDKMDRYFITYFLGLEATGTYNVVYNICSAISFLILPVRRQMMTYLPKLWDRGMQTEAISMIRHSLLFYLMIVAGLVGSLTFFFEEILVFLLQKDIQVQNLEGLVAIIGVGIIAANSRTFYNLLIKLKGKTIHEFVYQLAGLVPNFILNYLLIPQMGILGAALATLISYSLILIAVNFNYSLNLDRNFYLNLISFSVLALFPYVIKFLIPGTDLLLTIVAIGVSYLGYLVLVFLLNRPYVRSVSNIIKEFKLLYAPN